MRITACISACALLAACQNERSRSLDTTAIAAAMDSATARLDRGFATGQLDSSAAVLTDDHQSMPPNGPPLSGRANWLAWSKATLVGGQWTSAPTPESRIYAENNFFRIPAGLPLGALVEYWKGTVLHATGTLVSRGGRPQPVDLLAEYNAANDPDLGPDVGWVPALVSRLDPAWQVPARVSAEAGPNGR